MKRLSGFSLMEMMIVLAIVAIVAAASAPMVNKKMVRAASEKSPWIFTSGESIAYNLDNPDGIQDNKTARIGSGVDNPDGIHPRLYITTNNDTTPHIMFGHNGALMRLTAGGEKSNLWLNNRAVPAAANATVALGWGSNAATNRAVAVGMDSDAQSTGSIAMGNNAKARANVSIAIGDGAKAGFEGGDDANKFSAIAIGSEAIARPVRSIAIGRHAEATGSGSIAMGSSGNDGQDNRARAQGASSIAIGQSALAQNNNSIAIGGTAQVDGLNSIAIGSNAQAVKSDTIALGRGANANPGNAGVKLRAIAIGLESQATNSDAVAIGTRFAGRRTTASGIGSVALGSTSRATANFAIAIGGSTDTTATADGSTDVRCTEASAEAAVAIGADATSSNINSIAIGRNAVANNTNTITIGRFASTGAENSIAIGSGAAASGANSVAIGRFAVASAENSIAIGNGATAWSDNKDTIVLGSANTLVYIPGNLVVQNTTVLGANSAGSRTYIREENGNGHRYLYAIGQAYDKVDRQGDRGSITSFHIWHPGKIKVGSMEILATSDRRLKNVGKEFTSGLDKIKKLEVFNYTFKDDKDKTPRVGVMAQDLQKIFPDAVIKGEDGFLRIRMEDMFYAVINAIKELDNRTSLQEKKIKELEKRIEELEKRL